MMKSKHFSTNAFNGGPPFVRIGKQEKLVKDTTKHSNMRKKNRRNKICGNLKDFFSRAAFNLL